ncbi:MAG TPA: M20/M25/M40 family metallo-hydrolase [Nevskiaceae bacterium]|nr:M20/M25/M40 family metallo-hydrolase [Nevskiaceae bacterium]
MDNGQLTQFIDSLWDAEVVPRLTDYIRIPNRSPAFDADWVAHGHMARAVSLLAGWARSKLGVLPGTTLCVEQLPGRTPVIVIDVPATGDAPADDCVLLYGHLDKQPEMEGWSEGLGPWTPVQRGDRLYGRGGADDGYAIFAALSALLALQAQGIGHARCVILIEACEESGSVDLPHYVEHLAPRLGQPSLVVCLDSGCGDYERLWMTTSLRGLVGGVLRVRVLTEGVHSGDASGVVPSSFRILRELLARLEDAESGEILPRGFHAEIPVERSRQARVSAQALGTAVYDKFPWAGATRPVAKDGPELLLNRAWRPELEVIGAEGFPPVASAGNVLRPYSAVKLSLRLPPTVDANAAAAGLRQILTRDPPYGAEVSFAGEAAASGWDAPPLAPWLAEAVDAAARTAFGQPPAWMGEGGSIPFMGMLGEKFPAAQFLITGVLGPHSNAHGPDEFLHIPTGKRVCAAVAEVLGRHAQRHG